MSWSDHKGQDLRLRPAEFAATPCGAGKPIKPRGLTTDFIQIQRNRLRKRINRPSDALGLAICVGRPIHVAEHLNRVNVPTVRWLRSGHSDGKASWRANLDIVCCALDAASVLATKSMNVSLTPELRAAVERRVRSGRYGNASDVLQAGLRALEREELGAAWRDWQEARAGLPQEPITPRIEQEIEARIRSARRTKRPTARG